MTQHSKVICSNTSYWRPLIGSQLTTHLSIANILIGEISRVTATIGDMLSVT